MKDIKGYEGRYAVTSCGRVYSYKKKKFLSTYLCNGYERVSLRDSNNNQKNFLIHRLVAETYIDNPNNLDTVDHIDNCKTHNWVSNLQWMSREDNTKKTKGIKVKNLATGEIFESYSAAARVYEVHPNTIRRKALADSEWTLV